MLTRTLPRALATLLSLAGACPALLAQYAYEAHQVTPGGRYHPAVAYDTTRLELVLFGGEPDATLRTWRRTPAGWTSTPTAGLPLRVGAACAFDAARQRVVLFGGALGTTAFGSADDATRLWDGTSWQTLLPSPRPTPRVHAAMAYDAARQVVVLFGGAGTNGAEKDDTWEWDGTSWTQRVTAVKPAARWAHTMAYDATRGRTVLFGGYGENTGYHGDTWEWDGVAWVQRAVGSPGPSARRDTAMAWSPATGRCVLYGGQAFGSTTGDTWDWDGTTWQQRAASAGVRSGHRLAFDPVRNVVTMVAGYRQDGPAFDAWDWNGTSWTRLEGAAPQVSLGGNPFGHAACHDPVRGETVAVGGVEQGTSRFQTWVWNGTGWVQRSPTNAPPFRFDPMLCFDAVRAQVLLFGGENAGDFWTWDGTDWTPAPPGPPARSGGGFAFDHARGVAVLFGGFEHSGFTALDDTWEWNGTTWTQRTFAVRPSPRRWPAFGFDPATQALVLNGFLAGPADTWRYDGTQWTALAPATSPTTAIGQRQLLTDFHRGRLLLVGGVGFGPATQPYQIWEWDGATWTQRLSLLSMGKRSVFDDNRGRIVNLDGPVHELVIPVDVAGSGNAPLVALDRPVLGAPFRLDLGAPLGVFAWTFANVATPPTILSGGVFCGNEPYYLDANATIGLEAGPILTIVLPPIPVLTQLPLMVQQAVFDPSGCLRTSDALAIRVQSP